jgi:hypothetical protein
LCDAAAGAAVWAIAKPDASINGIVMHRAGMGRRMTFRSFLINDLLRDLWPTIVER